MHTSVEEVEGAYVSTETLEVVLQVRPLAAGEHPTLSALMGAWPRYVFEQDGGGGSAGRTDRRCSSTRRWAGTGGERPFITHQEPEPLPIALDGAHRS
jgi:hypothetical protein